MTIAAKTAVHNGTLYHSKKEAAYAAELDLRVKAGELKTWKRQVWVPLHVKKVKVCSYVVDFWLQYANGMEQWVEIKGYPNPVGELKIKMFKAEYPEWDYVVIR